MRTVRITFKSLLITNDAGTDIPGDDNHREIFWSFTGYDTDENFFVVSSGSEDDW